MLHFLGYHSVYHFGSLASLIFLGNIEENLNKGLRIRQTYLAYLFFFQRDIYFTKSGRFLHIGMKIVERGCEIEVQYCAEFQINKVTHVIKQYQVVYRYSWLRV